MKLEREEIKEWKENNGDLVSQMEEWRDNYECRNNCNDWQESKFCKHLVNARTQKFRSQIINQINFISEVIS